MPTSGNQRLRESEKVEYSRPHSATSKIQHRIFLYVMSGDEESRIDRAEVMMQYTLSLLKSFIPHSDTTTVRSSDDGRLSPSKSSSSSQPLVQESTEYNEAISQRLHPTHVVKSRRSWAEDLHSLGEALTSIYASITLDPSQRSVTEQSFHFFISLFSSDNLGRLRDGLIITRKSRCTHDIRTTLQDKAFKFDEPPEILNILASYYDRADHELRTMPKQILWLHYHADLFEAWKDACEEVERETSLLNAYIRQKTGTDTNQPAEPSTLLKNYIVSILYPRDPVSEAARAHITLKLEFAEKIWTLHNDLDAGVLALIAANTSPATNDISAKSLHMLVSQLVTTHPRTYANIVDICEVLHENVIAPVLEHKEMERLEIESIYDLSESGLSMVELFGADELGGGGDGGDGGGEVMDVEMLGEVMIA